MAKKTKPYVPLSSTPNFWKGITPQEEKFTGKTATQDQKDAWTRTGAQTDGTRNALQQQLSQLGKDRQYESEVQQNFGESGDKRLGELSGLLQEQLGGITGRAKSMYDNAGQATGAAYDKAGQAVQGASSDVTTALQEQMQRLGLTEAGPDPLQTLQQQQTDMSGRHAISGAGAVGNAGALGADMTSLSAMREGDSAQEFAGKRNDLASEVMANVNTINQEYNTQRDSVFSEIKNIERERGQLLEDNLKQIIEERMERERQEKLDTLADEMARRGMQVQEGYLGTTRDRLGLDTELGREGLNLERELGRGRLDLDAELGRGGLDIQRQQLGMQLEEHEAALANADSEWARLEAQVNIQRTEAEIANLDAQTRDIEGGIGGSGGDYSGFQGAQQWAQESFNPATAQEVTNSFWALQAQATDIASQSGANEETELRRLINEQPAGMRSALTEFMFILNKQHN